MKLIIAWTILGAVILALATTCIGLAYITLKDWRNWYQEALAVLAFAGAVAAIIWSINTISL